MNFARLTLGELSFEVDPAAGGRVTSLRLGSTEMLAGKGVSDAHYGSTVWTSPQSDWGWPPPPEFDEVPYGARVFDTVIELEGPPAAALGIQIGKRFATDEERGCIALTYTLKNASDRPKICAPWEVTRVDPGGLTFFPTGLAETGPLPVVKAAGATWYLHDPSVLDETGRKHSADGSGGFVAHAQHGLLFVKGFADLPPAFQAPGEGEVEVYGNNRYVEVEAQGPYTSLAPGQALSWTVSWWLRRLPPGLEPTVGDPTLLALAASIASSD